MSIHDFTAFEDIADKIFASTGSSSLEFNRADDEYWQDNKELRRRAGKCFPVFSWVNLCCCKVRLHGDLKLAAAFKR